MTTTEAARPIAGARIDSDTVALRPRHTGRRALLNTAAIAAGSNLAAFGRLVVIALIARRSGEATLAQYAVLIELFKLAEGLLDFGSTEVFVREINQRSSKRRTLLRILTATKLIQILPAFAVLAAGLWIVVEDPQLTRPGLLGGLALLAYAAVLIFRVPFRAQLSMHRELLAELISVGLLIALVLHVAPDASITTIIWAYVTSRLLFGGLCVLFGLNAFAPSIAGVSREDLAWASKSLVVIGVAGFVVVLYQTIDLLLLQRLVAGGADSIETAYFASGQKLAWPVLMALTAVGGTLYSVIASAWPDDRPRFNRACQSGLNAVFLLAGVPIAMIFAGGEFLVGLIDSDLASGGAAVARPVALLCLAKAVTMTIGPALFIVHKQRYVLLMLLVALLAKIAAILAVAPSFGATGVAWVSLSVEFVFTVIPGVALVRHFTGFRPSWWTPAGAIVAAAAAIAATPMLVQDQSLAAVLLAPTLYVALALALCGRQVLEPISMLRRDRREPQSGHLERHDTRGNSDP